MPDYRAPGVYVEEVPAWPGAIEGVDTATAGFVGPCRYGPLTGAPVLLTSAAAFERLYGDGGKLAFDTNDAHGADGATRGVNHLWWAVRSFFEEGGKRLYVSRVFQPSGDEPGHPARGLDAPPHADGHGRALIGTAPQVFRIHARHPGAMGNFQLRFTVRSVPDLAPGDAVGAITLDVEVLAADGRSVGIWPGLPLAPGRPGGLFDLFGAHAAGQPVVLLNGDEAGAGAIDDGIGLLQALSACADGLHLTLTPAELAASAQDEQAALRRKFEHGRVAAATLKGGNDGLLPGLAAYAGQPGAQQDRPSGLRQFECIDDIAIVAAPGAAGGAGVDQLLIAHAELMRYRIALLDPPEGTDIAGVRELRSRLNSSHAALYYPWVTVLDAATGRRLNLPPSGFVAGIYARSDAQRGVHKAPANEVVQGAIGFETVIGRAQQEVLNPEGINCFRFFAGRGHRLRGARTVSSDPEWKYVNLRRYVNYLAHAIDKGTQWVAFETQGEALWTAVRGAVSNFLQREWTGGALLGDKPEHAFFVRCDRSTMTQNDLDNGRLVCLIGIAPLEPAEFTILRIEQWTADRHA